MTSNEEALGSLPSSSATLMSNWKNVNNWHWVEKDCSDWAHSYLKEALKAVQASNSAISVEVKSIGSVEGEVDVNQRKGKILFFYDLRIVGHWTSENADNTKKASGTFTIPEFSPEIKGPSDLVFQVSFDDPSTDSEAMCKPADEPLFRSNIAKVLRAPIFEKLTKFRQDLETIHGSSILVPKEATLAKDTRQINPAVVAQACVSSTLEAPTSSSKSHSASAVSTTTLTQRQEFSASPEFLYEVLTDASKIGMWARCLPAPPEASNTLSSSYFLFDGNVECKNVKLLPAKMIQMLWRFKSWPEDVGFSTVTLSLQRDGSMTVLNLEQVGVPSCERDRLEENWKEYYWNPIKRVFGLGTDF